MNVDVPAAVGVPDIVPLWDSESPGGKVPDAILHVYGGVPPAAVRL